MVFLNMYLKHIVAIQFEIKQTQTVVSCGSGCPSPSSRRPLLALLRGLDGAEGEGAGAGSASSAIAADQPRLWKMLTADAADQPLKTPS